MAENGRGLLFRKRNVLGAALVAGIGLGVYLGQFKGFGLGGGSHFGIGTSDGGPGEGAASQTVAAVSEPVVKPLESTKSDEALAASDVIRVVIDEREFLVRSGKKGDAGVAVTLPKLMELIEKAPGDADGIRVRISMKANARASAEEKLRKELEAAGIDDAAILWVPTPVQQ